MRLLYDCDAGADDALALKLLVKSGAELAGISTCFGGFPPEKAAIRAESILKSEGKSVPVCVGAHHSLQRGGPVHSDAAFPRDGQRMDAGLFFAEKFKEPTILLATGPLTNVALMLRICEKKPERIYIMGGGISGGNRTKAAEFNFFCDPEAADEVLQSGCPITLVPLEAARECAITPEMLPDFSPAVRELLQAMLDFSRRTHGQDFAIPYDAVAAAGLLDESIFVKTSQCTCRVDCSQGEQAGALLIDDRPGKITLVESADPEAFLTFLHTI